MSTTSEDAPVDHQSALRDTPFPHDLASVLFRGDHALNTGHFSLLIEIAPTRGGHDDRVHGTPAGCRFTFQDPRHRRALQGPMAISQRIARTAGVRILGYSSLNFWDAEAGSGRRLMATSIAYHRHSHHDIIYVIKNNEGKVIARAANAEPLAGIGVDVPFALKA